MAGKNPIKQPSKLAEVVIQGIQEKKGLNIVCLDLQNISNAVSDYFIICHGTSNIHVDAIADSVKDEAFNALGEKPWHVEGVENAEWILIDFVDVVVHVFQEEAREFFNLEELWADAQVTELENAY